MNMAEESNNQSQETGAEGSQDRRGTDATADATGDAPASGASEAQSKALIDELNTLAAKLAEAVDVAWNSEQRKRLEDDLRTGVGRVATSLEQHLKELSQREDARKVLDKAEDVAGKVRSSKVSQEIAAVLTQGLRALGDQLDKLAQDLRERDTTGKEAVDPANAAANAAENDDKPDTNESDGEIPIQRG